MGIVLSRLWGSAQHSRFFLVSVFQAQYRRLFYSKRSTSSRNCLYSSTTPKKRTAMLESVGTQTLGRVNSRSSSTTRSKVRLVSKRTFVAGASSEPDKISVRKRHCTKMFERVKFDKKMKTLLSSTPSPQEATASSQHISHWTHDSRLTPTRFVFPDVHARQEVTVPVAHSCHSSDAFSQLSIDKTRKLSADNMCERCITSRCRSKRTNGGTNNGCGDEVSSEGSNASTTSSSDFNDICIIENPDFSRFGHLYRSLASPNDSKLLPSVETRCRCVSYLSPVKEEHDTDTSSDNGIGPSFSDNGIGPSFSETFPVFEELDDLHGTHHRRRHSSGGLGRGRAPNHTLIYSFSSDSGFGERLRDSKASSSDHSLHFSNTTSESSDSEGSARTSVSHCAGDLDMMLESRNDVFEREIPWSEANCDCYRTTCFKFEDEPCVEIFNDKTLDKKVENDEGLIKIENSHPSGKIAETALNSSQKETSTVTTGSATTRRPPLQPLTIGARRKVTFSGDLTGSGSSSSESCSPPSSCTSSSSSLMSRCRPTFTRQDSADSTTSTSSVESLMAVPLSPTSPASPEESSAFVFPAKHFFAEPSEGCDLVLVAEGEQFHVHRSVVAWQCHVLLLHMRETKSHEVVLPDKRADDVLSFLNVLYPFCRQNINERNLEALLDLSQSLGCERVKRTCTTYLIGLAQFHHLCPHRHLIPSNVTESHHGHDVNGRHQENDVTNGTKVNIVRPHRRVENGHGSSVSDSASRSTVPTGNDSFPLTNITEISQPLSSLCACADTMADRVLEILHLAVKYELDDVYHTYLDVTASMRVEELTTCPRFTHLSPATREDVLTSRVTHLESLVSNISVTRSDLIGCDRVRHQSYRVTFNGELCLRCMSRNLLREAKGSC